MTLILISVALVALVLLWVKLLDESLKRQQIRHAQLVGFLMATEVMSPQQYEILERMYKEAANGNKTNQA
jgi:uncharacterized membrane protein YjdF